MSDVKLTMKEITALAKRRGFIFQSSEIYGGAGGCWDYGPLGVELKNNLRRSWWKNMTLRKDVVGIDSSILMNPSVWKASGHVDNFSDPMVDCKKCKSRFREDKIDTQAACPTCGAKNEFTEAKEFNLMFETNMGPVNTGESKVYLRPETAQGIFVNFLNVQTTMRKKIPFGIAQTGKAFRNEITPGHFIFRMREFEQMEMQYFVRPDTQKDFIEKWKDIRLNWLLELGINKENLRFHKHDKLAHYADAAYDIEFNFPMGFDELEGIHSRTDFDLGAHQNLSGKSLQYVDQVENKKYIPYVIETSICLDRLFLAFMHNGLFKEGINTKEERTVLKLHRRIAPIKIAILPLMKKTDLEERSTKIFNDLNSIYEMEYDNAGSIGKRYRRQDEIGTPFCLTVDYDTLGDGTVTIRDRDSMQQEKVSENKLIEYFSKIF